MPKHESCKLCNTPTRPNLRGFHFSGKFNGEYLRDILICHQCTAKYKLNTDYDFSLLVDRRHIETCPVSKDLFYIEY